MVSDILLLYLLFRIVYQDEVWNTFIVSNDREFNKEQLQSFQERSDLTKPLTFCRTG